MSQLGKLILISTEDDFDPVKLTVEIEYTKNEMQLDEVVDYITKFLQASGWAWIEKLEVHKKKEIE